MMHNISRKRRRNRIIDSLQQVVDTFPKPSKYDSITRISVSWMEDKLDGFIIFLNQDKKRLLNLEKSKFEYLEYLVERSRKAVMKNNKPLVYTQLNKG